MAHLSAQGITQNENKARDKTQKRRMTQVQIHFLSEKIDRGQEIYQEQVPNRDKLAMCGRKTCSSRVCVFN